MEDQIEELKDYFYLNESVREGYLNCILDGTYQISNDEIGIAAYLFNKHAFIYNSISKGENEKLAKTSESQDSGGPDESESSQERSASQSSPDTEEEEEPSKQETIESPTIIPIEFNTRASKKVVIYYDAPYYKICQAT